MTIVVDVQYACHFPSVPNERQIEDWAQRALAGLRAEAELTVRIVNMIEAIRLNERWRKASGPSNVLAFPAAGLEEIKPELLGDIIICAPLVESEARQQGKSPAAHWAHMIVHGILHLVGYDHIEETAADEMEAVEIEILQRLGYDNPYV